jgi:hypothetical protein
MSEASAYESFSSVISPLGESSSSAGSGLKFKPLEQLEDDIISLSQHINSSEYQFLELIREFDIRQGWKSWLCSSSAEWLNFKCGMSLGTAREKVRVAMALFDLPACSAAFAQGSLSYSKARALSRVANRHNEKDLLAFAVKATAAQVERQCQQLRNAQRRLSTRDANHAHNSRYLRRQLLDDGTMTISMQLTQEAGELVMQAIAAALATLAPATRSETATQATGATDATEACASDEFFKHQADALVEVARGFLAGGSEANSSSADHYQVMVHVDEAALREQASPCGCSDYPIESVRRLLCDSSMIPVVEDHQGIPLNVGRKQRVVSPPMKRALRGRDKCCRFPGCDHQQWLDAHHVKHWIDGGETSMANTLLLCGRHHRLLHEGGFSIQANHNHEWYFRNAAGKILQ